jgi:hypothetical protein
MARHSYGRTSESEIAIAALRIAGSRPNGEVSTHLLKQMIPDYINLTPGDLNPSPTRPNEQMWHQIVGNIISHRENEGNIIGDGYADYTGTGIRITQAGRLYLRSLGHDE